MFTRIFLVLALSCLFAVETETLTAAPTTPRAEDTRVRLSIENDFKEPYFNESVYLPFITGQQLIRYLEEAAETSKAFKFSVTYIPKFGYFINTINGAIGVWEGPWWTIHSDGKLTKGASSYVPHKGDHVIFKYNKVNYEKGEK